LNENVLIEKWKVTIVWWF